MLFLILWSLLILSVHSVTEEPILIVVSFDAFRYNYFDKNATTFLSDIRKQGTTAEHLKNVFPTKTFPNHHSISTGVYPEVHGVTGNNFFDPKLNKIVSLSEEMYNYNENIIPIWTLNQMSGKNRRSGIMMWPGAIYKYQNIMPYYMEKWNPKVSWYKRVDTIITWLTDKHNPANLIMFYIEEPDTHGHAFGPNSRMIYDLLEELDSVSKYLYDELKRVSLLQRTNVVHISDHGMIAVKPPQAINITQYLIPNTYLIADTSPTIHIIPKNASDEEDIYLRLKRQSMLNKHYKIYRKKEILDKWHFRNNRRIPPILAVAEPGYAFEDLLFSAKIYEQKYNITITNDSEMGVHGYDNDVKDMNPFFIAYGPNIKVNHKVPPFSTLDLYSLFCALLNIEPPKNNGTYANIRDILAPVKANTVSSVHLAVGGCILFFVMIGCLISIRLLVRKKKFRSDFPTSFSKILQHDKNTFEAQHLLESEEI